MLLPFLLLLLLPLSALAQALDVANPDGGAVFAQQLLDAVTRGDWWMVAGVAVAFLVWALRNPLRRFVPAKAQAVIDMPVVAFLVPVVLAVAGGFSTAAAAGPITGAVVVTVLVGALKTSMAAAFSFLFGANLKEQTQVKTLEQAAEVLRQGPPQS